MDVDKMEDEIFKFKKTVDNAKVEKAKLEGRMQSLKEKLNEMGIKDLDHAKEMLEKWKELREVNLGKLEEGYNLLKKEIE